MKTWNTLATEIHADNVKAGWWTDLKTGESLLETRDRLNLCMLVVTELNEAYVAHCENAFDDKLPQFPGVGVELADAQIRILDMLGAELDRGHRFDLYVSSYLSDIVVRRSHIAYEPAHAQAVSFIAGAAEHFRKGRGAQASHSLQGALNFIEGMGQNLGFDMEKLREAKRDYNRHRSDHKIENRVKDGGKKF